MKYAITGHTSGIGKRLFERLLPNAVGFSKSSGYDINLKRDRERIIQESLDCDVFVNNAHSGFSQTLLFLELHSIWRMDPTKTIINIGSRIAEINSLSYNKRHLLIYQAEKVSLKEMSHRVTGKCSVKYKWFGYVGTQKILEKYPHFTEQDYITEDKAVDIILN
jgi:hypothetical protein